MCSVKTQELAMNVNMSANPGLIVESLITDRLE